MEMFTKAAWTALALIHLLPAAAAFAPSLISRLYGADVSGDLFVLLEHRGALFFAIFVACLFGVFDPPARRALCVVVSISVVGFLVIYWRAGLPAGPLRTIALADFVALVPLAWVAICAWRPQVA
jgi:hypothetical protein